MNPTWPYSEQYLEQRRNFPWNPLPLDLGPRRSAPAELPFIEWDPNQQIWKQGDKVLPNFKPNKYWVRPHDGKRPGTLGRLKDALTGEGADLFITLSGDKRTLMRDRPQRWQWTGWGLSPTELEDKRMFDIDFREQDLSGAFEGKKTAAMRGMRPLYDFRSRKYRSVERAMRDPWSIMQNAHWPEGASRRNVMPLSWRDGMGNWMSPRVPWWSGAYPGGRPRWPTVGP